MPPTIPWLDGKPTEDGTYLFEGFSGKTSKVRVRIIEGMWVWMQYIGCESWYEVRDTEHCRFAGPLDEQEG